MAGTFADQATLANSTPFVNACRVAMLFRAVSLITGNTPQTATTLNKMMTIFNNAGADATSMAWRVAIGNPSIAAAAPALPPDSDIQFAVNTFLAQE